MTQSGDLPVKRGHIKEADEKTVAEIVLEVELSKQLKPPLTNQQRVQLIRDLMSLHKPESILRAMARSVKLKDTYNTIAFQYWVEPMVCLRSDLERTAEYRAHQIIAEQKLKARGEDLIGEHAIWRLSALYQDEFESAVAKRVRHQKEAVKKLSAKIGAMNTMQRTKLLKCAVAAGIIPEYDPTLLPHMHLNFMALALLPLYETKPKVKDK